MVCKNFFLSIWFENLWLSVDGYTPSKSVDSSLKNNIKTYNTEKIVPFIFFTDNVASFSSSKVDVSSASSEVPVSSANSKMSSLGSVLNDTYPDAKGLEILEKSVNALKFSESVVKNCNKLNDLGMSCLVVIKLNPNETNLS